MSTLPLGEKLRRAHESKERESTSRAREWARTALPTVLDIIREFAENPAMNSGCPNMTISFTSLPPALRVGSSIDGWEELAVLLRDAGFEAESDQERKVQGCAVRWG